MKRRPATAGAVQAGAPDEPATLEKTGRPAPLGRRGWLVLGAVVLLVKDGFVAPMFLQANEHIVYCLESEKRG